MKLLYWFLLVIAARRLDTDAKNIVTTTKQSIYINLLSSLSCNSRKLDLDTELLASLLTVVDRAVNWWKIRQNLDSNPGKALLRYSVLCYAHMTINISVLETY